MLIALFFAAEVLADVYKTVDKDGHVVYSDNPPDDQAEAIKLPNITTLPSDTPIPHDNSEAPVPQEIHYEVRVISPRNEVSIPPGERDLAVAINLTPSLGQDHLITYYLDGELLQETQSTSIVIQDVPRGARTLTVEVIDQNGEVLGQSEPLTINVIRPIKKAN